MDIILRFRQVVVIVVMETAVLEKVAIFGLIQLKSKL